jgi:hypothetical protein
MKTKRKIRFCLSPFSSSSYMFKSTLLIECQSSNAPESRQHFYEPPRRDDAGRIKKIENGAIHGRSTSIDGRLPSSSSHSLPSSSFRHWASLESIQRNQRLKQLAAQSTTKVRYRIVFIHFQALLRFSISKWYHASQKSIDEILKRFNQMNHESLYGVSLWGVSVSLYTSIFHQSKTKSLACVSVCLWVF